jgi:hypothetical protein
MAMHTFLREGQVDRDTLFVQQCKRLKYLKGKFLNDLASGEKILVCRSARDLTDPVIIALFRAVRAYGGSGLLCVRLAGEGGLPGTVTKLEPGLLVASIDRLGPQRGPAGDTWDISFDVWMRICREAVALHRAEW